VPAVGLKDVARIAGVSYKTVSRVVNGEAPVGEATRHRVEAAIAELGYRPNQSARNLRRGRTQTIRLVMYLREAELRQERFQDDVVAAIINRATAANYSVLLELTRASDSPAQIARFGDRRSDGTILLDARVDSPVVSVLRQAAEPTVILVNPDADPGFGSIDADFVGGAETIVTHLIALGHQNIAHLADDMALHSSRGRRSGYESALRRAGRPVTDDLVEMSGYSRQHGHEGTARLLARRPDVTAIFCVNDLTAFGAIDYLHESGRRVPDDVSVTGYDDLALARYSSPPLTTLHIPWYEMAEAATESLIAALTGEHTTPVRRTFPVDVVPRKTTTRVHMSSQRDLTQIVASSTKGGS
jgi:DNA-binding LacI/PurR family transcriptional regulator